MTSVKPSSKSFLFRYINCRNISSPEDDAEGRRIYSGHAPSSSVLKLEDNENVRQYLVDAPGKVKRSPTQVHQAIRRTLADKPQDFSVLNGGMVIVARSAEVDDKRRIITLIAPSIINGSQTQGELKRYFDCYKDHEDFREPSIKYELIITDDDDLIAEISIARNFQNDVRTISIAGRRGQLDELEDAFQKVHPKFDLRKKETDIVSDEEDFIDTEKLIQVIFALMPLHLLRKLEVADGKVFSYSQKTRCLKLFQKIYDEKDADMKEVYSYFLSIAGVAWTYYLKWKSHPGFKGTRLRAIERSDGSIVEVPDGIVFPIVAALSAFVSKVGSKWVVSPPDNFSDDILIEAAKEAYMDIAGHNPQSMGKSKACYSSLLRLTSIYAQLK